MIRLLYVDSDPRSLNVLGVSLRQSGYDVITSADSVDALATIESGAPHLLITATRLHKIDGFALVRKLRERSQTADLPVIFIGNEESPEDRKCARELGVEDFLKKPVFARELVARVKLNLARRAQEYILDSPKLGCTHLSGSTLNVAVVDLVQSFEATARSGAIHLRSGAQEAHLYFRDGRVIDAELGALRGEEAVYRSFVWYDASFEIELKSIANKDVIGCSTQTVVRKGMQHVDQWLRPSAPPASADRAAELVDGTTPRAPELTPPTADATSRRDHSGARADRDEGPPGPADPRDSTSALRGLGRAMAETPLHATPSRPSSAPWTREIEEGADTTLGGEEIASLPRARRAARRFVAATMTVAVLLVVGGAVRAWQRQEQRTQLDRDIDHFGATAGTSVPRGTDMAFPATLAERAEAPAESAASDEAAPVESAATPAGPGPAVPATAELATSAEGAAGAAKETPIDVKLAVVGQSRLVRDAEQALLQGQTERALSLAQQAVATAPADADSWLILAAAQKASGDVAAASDSYRKCTERAHTVGLDHCRTLANRRTESAGP
jgi:DNA-binding response OmpR family regulator